MSTLQLIVVFVVGIMVLSSARAALEYPIRAKRWQKRLMRTDGMTWRKIIGESRKQVGSKRTPHDQMKAVKAFSQTVSEIPDAFATIAWHKDEHDIVHLYLGVTSNLSGGSAGVFSRTARGLNARIEEVKGPPPFNPDNVISAYRQSYDQAQVSRDFDNVGVVATDISENTSIPSGSTIMLTFEGAGAKERSLFQGDMAERAIMSGGESAKYSGSADRSATMASTLVRGRIAASSGTADKHASESILSYVLSSIPSLGYRVTKQSPREHMRRKSVMVSIPAAVASALFTFLIPAIPLPLGIAMFIISIATPLVALIRPSMIFDRYLEAEAEDGYLSISKFKPFSIKRIVNGLFTQNFRRDAGSYQSSGNRVAPPSDRDVVHFYETSLAEYMTLPDNARVDDLGEDRLPKKGIGSKFTHREDNDMFYGFSGTGQQVSVPIASAYKSIFCSGAPDSGKTHLLEFLYMNMSYLSKSNTEGYQITPIWSEIKGEGAYEVYDMVKDINPRAIFVDANNPRGKFRLALEGPRLTDINRSTKRPYKVGTVMRNISSLVDGLQFSYGSGIAAESRQALSYSLSASMLLFREDINYLELDKVLTHPDRPNVIHLAYLLLGGDPDVQLKAKLGELRKSISDSDDKRHKQLYRALGVLIKYNDPKNAKKEPALNKLSDLVKADSFWEPRDNAREVYISQLPKHFAPIILNMGPYRQRNGNWSGMNNTISRHILLTTFSMLWSYIKNSCSGWQSQRKMVPLFFDEVKNVAVNSTAEDIPNLMNEVHSEGRSKGTFLVAATQNVTGQIPEQAENTAMSFPNKVTFALPDKRDRERLMHQIKDNGTFADEHLRNIYRPFAVVISMFHSEQNGNFGPFTLEVPFVGTWKKYLMRNNNLTSAITDYEHCEEKQSDSQLTNAYE